MKIIVIDDDPTGSQTVHDCLLLLKWDYETLLKGLKNKSNLLFILANTRSLSEKEVIQRLGEICFSLKKVLNKLGFTRNDYLLVTRGDSTLRGHNFLEPKVINQLLGPYDATFHIPAFIEGKRITINGEHYVNNLPINQTIFAKDEIFGFKTSNIKDILQAKSNQELNENQIQNINLKDIQLLEIDQKNKVYQFIKDLKSNPHIILDISDYYQLEKFSSVIRHLIKKKRFLFRTAASFINSISEIKKDEKDKTYFSSLRRKNKKNYFMNGLIIIGSSVNLTTIQMNKILEIKDFKAIELDVMNFYKIYKLRNNLCQMEFLKKQTLLSIRSTLKRNLIPVLFTSRKIFTCKNKSNLLKFHNCLSLFIADIVLEIKYEIGYLISKGGITSNTILTNGFDADFVYLEGQVLPGISLVTLKMSDSNEKFPIVTFPGNIGDETSLVKVIEALENKKFNS